MFCLLQFFPRAIAVASALLIVASGLPANAQTITYVPAYTFRGDAVDDEFGRSVSGAGDVNNDGYADLIIGARGDDNNGSFSGSARVLSGQDGSVLYTFNGDSSYGQFGQSVSGVGDVNNDGHADMIVGAHLVNNNGLQGFARVFSGQDGSILYTVNGESETERFGVFVSGAGDVNADGVPDMIVGGGGAFDGTDRGVVRVLSGIDGSVLHTFTGDGPGDGFGGALSGAGDVNGDGYADFIAGAGDADGGGGSNSGTARVYSGQNGSTLYTFIGDRVGVRFGRSVSEAGDVNGDGYPDLIVGAQFFFGGTARVLSGRDGSTLYSFNGDNGAFLGDLFGSSVSGAGDVNNDGFSDLLVGARGDDDNGLDSGSARVLSGQDGSILYTFNGDSSGDQFGYMVSQAGDVNGDGLEDLIVGTFDGNYARVFVSQVSGRTLLVDFGGDRPPGNGNASSEVRTLGTNADFHANDPSVWTQASVVNFDFLAGDQSVSSNASLEVSVDIDMVDPNDPSIRFDPIPFNPSNGSFADGVPILDGYYFALDSLNLEATISGLQEIAPGDRVTLTVYAVGDVANQDGTIEAFYNNISLGTQFTEAAGPIEATFAQYTFNKISGVNSLRFVNSGNSASPFRTFNGFSISTEPAPLLTLGDVNLDGVVSFLDIAPFIAVLSSGVSQAEADCNQDGFVNFLDIGPFIILLSS